MCFGTSLPNNSMQRAALSVSRYVNNLTGMKLDDNQKETPVSWSLCWLKDISVGILRIQAGFKHFSTVSTVVDTRREIRCSVGTTG